MWFPRSFSLLEGIGGVLFLGYAELYLSLQKYIVSYLMCKDYKSWCNQHIIQDELRSQCSTQGFVRILLWRPQGCPWSLRSLQSQNQSWIRRKKFYHYQWSVVCFVITCFPRALWLVLVDCSWLHVLFSDYHVLFAALCNHLLCLTLSSCMGAWASCPAWSTPSVWEPCKCNKFAFHLSPCEWACTAADWHKVQGIAPFDQTLYRLGRPIVDRWVCVPVSL